jgi:hypothetical protein
MDAAALDAEVDAAADAHAGEAADASLDAGADDPFACAEGPKLKLYENIATLDFGAAPSGAGPSCVRLGDQRLYAYSFESDRAGFVAFTLESASGVAVPSIAVLERCGGREIDCRADGLTSRQEIVIWTEPGDRRLVVVGTGASEPTDSVYTLRAEGLDCPARDLDRVALPAFVNTAGSSKREALCGGGDHGERELLFRAPTTGAYRFASEATFFTPLLSLRAGARCGGQEIACARGMGVLKRAVVGAHLQAGQEINVVVDGSDGAGIASLDVTRVDGDLRCEVPNVVGPKCFDLTSECSTDVSTEDESYPGRVTSSCAAPTAPNAVVDFMFPGGGGDGCSTTCDVTLSSADPFSIARFAGGCNTGIEEACFAALQKGPGCDVDGGAAYCAQFSLETHPDTYTPEAHYSVVITPADGTPHTYDVSTSCRGICR